LPLGPIMNDGELAAVGIPARNLRRQKAKDKEFQAIDFPRRGTSSCASDSMTECLTVVFSGYVSKEKPFKDQSNE